MSEIIGLWNHQGKALGHQLSYFFLPLTFLWLQEGAETKDQ